MSGDLEKDIESCFKRELERRGCLVMKFVSPGLAGVPDRLVLFPSGRIEFVELKRQGEKTRPLQRAVIKMFQKRQIKVYVLDSREAVRGFVRLMERGGAFDS